VSSQYDIPPHSEGQRKPQATKSANDNLIDFGDDHDHATPTQVPSGTASNSAFRDLLGDEDNNRSQTVGGLMQPLQPTASEREVYSLNRTKTTDSGLDEFFDADGK
jgi:hypothetical protein